MGVDLGLSFLKEERRLMVFENEKPRTTFGQ
jgi:hypothetical protein